MTDEINDLDILYGGTVTGRVTVEDPDRLFDMVQEVRRPMMVDAEDMCALKAALSKYREENGELEQGSYVIVMDSLPEGALTEVDYSEIEKRVLAYSQEDVEMMKAMHFVQMYGRGLREPVKEPVEVPVPPVFGKGNRAERRAAFSNRQGLRGPKRKGGFTKCAHAKGR